MPDWMVVMGIAFVLSAFLVLILFAIWTWGHFVGWHDAAIYYKVPRSSSPTPSSPTTATSQNECTCPPAFRQQMKAAGLPFHYGSEDSLLPPCPLAGV